MKTARFILPALLLSALTMTGLVHADGAHQHADATATAGAPGKASAITRTINIAMGDDMRFSPANVTVKQGETIKFIVANNGKLKHEMVIGSAAELAKHAEAMRQMPGMQHQDANQVTVEPGKSAELLWRFSKAMTVDFACLEPGHFEAGMKGSVSVVKSNKAATGK
ncbi:plastocyanin/azurin family copper-binding protein [Glaciimonas sp. PCH181]|uniref:cupredoxin domain-containing protein n=1 Tax=Glaciimonas sp. PCH181 TaxID=2133943 RepID=UPI001CED6D44|nr:cupredoxin family protein [Glaciimonas sp. PCH181]